MTVDARRRSLGTQSPHTSVTTRCGKQKSPTQSFRYQNAAILIQEGCVLLQTTAYAGSVTSICGRMTGVLYARESAEAETRETLVLLVVDAITRLDGD